MVSVSECASNILTVAVISALVSLGAWVLDFLMEEGQLLSRWGTYVDGKNWCKPLGGCVVCTAFWWGWLIGGVLTLNIAHGLATALLAVYIIRKHLYA
jgi:hypothetical protein